MEECRAASSKASDLTGGSPGDLEGDEAGRQLLDNFMQDCARNRRLSRTNYDCVMDATSREEFQKCHAFMDFRH